MDARAQLAALQAIRAIADTIRDARSVPSGHLYAALMAQGCTLPQFERIVGLLVESQMVRKSGDLLEWVGPVAA